jgi:ATP-dependent Lon protease
VRKLKPNTRGSIICLVGPPGVGKTSMGKSIASALNRKFFRFSLGGMRDEAEIKGHRRTYIGSMPGKIIQALRIVKTKNPVIMLDEIDKLGISYQGDPSSALLEVLDPEQNTNFRDHYIDMPFDLSNVLFITTANTVDTIPRPLLDRMEVIRLSGYILEEKMKIAVKYIIPRQLERHGITQKNLSFTANALKGIIAGYAREAGLRNFERNVEKICRKVATEVASKGAGVRVTVDAKDLEKYLGKELFLSDLTEKAERPGIAIGLAWTEMGGSTLTIECIAAPIKKQQGSINLTGQLGEVMVESAKIAYSYIRSIAKDFGVKEEFFEDNMLHLHIPTGATPKDGPSAGITMATAILSLARGKIIDNAAAMTGEISLTGKVLPIGGLKEKVIAAKRVGFIKRIIIPAANRKDLDEIPDYIRRGIKFIPVESYKEVVTHVF